MDQPINRFEYAAKIVLYVVAVLLPLWVFPIQISADFGREVVLGALVVVSAVLGLISILTKGEIYYRRSPILWAAAALLLVFGISTILSRSPMISLLLADASTEKLSTLILGVLLMILLGSLFRSRSEAGAFILLLVFSSALLGVLTVIQFLFDFSLYRLMLPAVANGIGFSPIGPTNSLALYYAALFILTVVFLLAPPEGWKSWVRYVLMLAAAVFLFNLFLIHYRIAWIVLLGSGIFLFGLLSKTLGMKDGRGEVSWRYWFALALLVLSIVMVMIRGPVFVKVGFPAEVAPSLSGTWRVVSNVFKEGVRPLLLGSGPGTFAVDWQLYKDPAVNQTIFWNVRFNQGNSLVATLPATVGILGLLAFLGFTGVSIFLFLRYLLLSKTEEGALPRSTFLAFVAAVLAIFLYPANLTIIILLFVALGLLHVLMSGGGSGFWSIREKTISFKTPGSLFSSSLIIIFFLALGIAVLYMQVGRIRAAVATRQGFVELNRGSVEEAISKLESAVSFDERHYAYHQNLVIARMEKIRSIIQRASKGEDVQQEFQNTVSSAVQSLQRATDLNPSEASLWRQQGAFYELIIPFIQGAERFSFEGYRKAAELDPLDPSIWTEWGRSGIVFADRIQIAMDQAKKAERESLGQARVSVLRESEQLLKKAVGVKPDFAQAHFLLAQIALRLGDAGSAVKSVEAAKLTAPFDIGIAFQLGLLYYQNNDFDRAEAEFKRALSLNQDYSNARYFLGLIYARRGNKEAAIKEFERVLTFNPNNQEVRKILSNLRGGKRALEGIVPLESRKEAPVR
ncbi:MAG: tetratricopeptide repeat protein [Candidatus Sungiibacteriota bacterium]|uniref:Tetratricopeptide repeat protein n=1 Tax=Candidatus Sungiibacteriota bacterium TaxID=2750080 RepID=A0A7T5UQF8_9BACT|nr:MAG: tetratricopeptide repeat protein [Candidatus Sungbacteria bacterium]